MNQHQKNYALNRIEGLKQIKLNKAEEKFTKPEVKLSDLQKYELIKSGKVKILSFQLIDRKSYPYLYDSYDFSKFEFKSMLINEFAFNVIKTNIMAISQKAKDQIMLGDCEEALKLINELENIKIWLPSNGEGCRLSYADVCSRI